MEKDDKYYEWISSTLKNDEGSSNNELRMYFMKEGKMSLKEAHFYVKQRENALNNIHYKLKKFRGEK